MQMQPSPQGIASLYMGNPGALQQKVQKEQQANPGLPPDLKNLMALSIVTNEQDAAKRQEAMNALQQMPTMGGQMPTVAQSLQEQAKQKLQAQVLQQQRQQMAMQELAKQGGIAAGVPENVPQPERQPQGIDQLPAEIGEFCGGGIVAFAEGDTTDYETPYDRMNRENREREAREGGLMGQLASAWKSFIGEPDNSPESLPEWARALRNTRLAKEEARAARVGAGRGLVNPAMVNPNAAAPEGLSAEESQGVSPPEPKAKPNPAGLAVAAAAAARPQSMPSDFSQYLEKSIRGELGADRETEAQRMMDKQREILGLAEQQKARDALYAERKARMEQAKENRLPLWAAGLGTLSGAPIRGGLGMMLGQVANATAKANEAYGAEDARMAEDLEKLKIAAIDAQAKGNTELARGYMDVYKEVDARRRSALQSGTSLENTRESAKSREQIAADNRAARAAAAAAAQEARTDKADEAMRAKALSLAMAAAQKAKADPMNMVKYKDLSTEQIAASMYDALYQGLKTGKIPTAPGAASPGGTPADIKRLLNKYGGS